MKSDLKLSAFVFAILLGVLYIYELVFVLKPDEKVSYTQFFFEKGFISFIVALAVYIYNSRTKEMIQEPIHVTNFDD